MNIIQRAQAHLEKNNMSYASHFVFAAGHGLRCFKAAAYLLVHSVLPCFFEQAGSKLVARLARDFTEHRKKHGE